MTEISRAELEEEVNDALNAVGIMELGCAIDDLLIAFKRVLAKYGIDVIN